MRFHAPVMNRVMASAAKRRLTPLDQPGQLAAMVRKVRQEPDKLDDDPRHLVYQEVGLSDW